MNAQNLSQHQWKHRVVLILTNNPNNLIFQDQIKALELQKTGFEDRKLIIYQITPMHFKNGISKDNSWTKKPELYRDIKTNDSSFEVILIGLDGEVKLRKNTVLTVETLFNTIDAMPMRRSELKTNQGSKN